MQCNLYSLQHYGAMKWLCRSNILPVLTKYASYWRRISEFELRQRTRQTQIKSPLSHILYCGTHLHNTNFSQLCQRLERLVQLETGLLLLRGHFRALLVQLVSLLLQAVLLLRQLRLLLIQIAALFLMVTHLVAHQIQLLLNKLTLALQTVRSATSRLARRQLSLGGLIALLGRRNFIFQHLRLGLVRLNLQVPRRQLFIHRGQLCVGGIRLAVGRVNLNLQRRNLLLELVHCGAVGE